MPDITLSMTTNSYNRLVAATCGTYEYSATLYNEQTGETYPNPETEAQFTKRLWREAMIKLVKGWEEHLAEEAARASHVPIEIT